MFASKDSLLTRPSGGYTIDRSVRTRSSATAYFNRTMGTPTNSAKWTWSFWLKRGKLAGSDYPILYSAGIVAAEDFGYFRAGTEALWVVCNSVTILSSTQVFRDTAAWYNMIFVFDGGNATASNRLRVYLNGVEITAWATDIRSTLTSSSSNVNKSGTVHRIATDAYMGAGDFYDGYLTEINFIDGQALTPSSFGETDSSTGVWKPKAFSGTYGTNGFYLNFSDNSASTAATIGKDYSGNGNNWTPNNISVTAGVTYDSMVDSPTVGSLSSNYAVLAPTWAGTTSSIGGAWSNGNLKYTTTSTNQLALSSFALPSSGKYYWEVTLTTIFGGYPNSNPKFGICDGTYYASGLGAWYVRADGLKYNQSSTSSACFGSAFADGNVVAFAVDMDSQTITFYKNNTAGSAGFTSILSGASGNILYPFVGGSQSGDVFDANFGQRPFSYTPPTGFVALNTYNLPASTITNGAAYMAATLYTGTGASLTVANTVGSTSFQPDWVWAKSRSAATDHALYDSVRGVQKQIESNNTDAETTETTGLTAFGSTGFTVGALAQMNTSAATYVAWQWKAGTTSASNTSGSITSTVSAGATQGFSVVTYTGTGSAATIGHGLGVAPKMVITKVRSTANNWGVYHSGINDPSKALLLDSTAAAASYGGATGMWNNTAPTSTVFSVGTNGSTGGSATYVAYCFAAVAGYSAFGSYTGNGSADGPFVYTNFQPRWLMVKRTDTAGFDWVIIDTARDPVNVMGNDLYANSSSAEVAGVNRYDFLSNGFKVRTTGNNFNANGGTYIYASFASNPLKLSLAR